MIQPGVRLRTVLEEVEAFIRAEGGGPRSDKGTLCRGTAPLYGLSAGRSGTLGEFAIAYEQGKLIGVLEGTGGITGALPALEATLHKQTGSVVIYENDPAVLVDRLLQRYQSADYHCPCYPDSAGTHTDRVE